MTCEVCKDLSDVEPIREVPVLCCDIPKTPMNKTLSDILATLDDPEVHKSVLQQIGKEVFDYTPSMLNVSKSALIERLRISVMNEEAHNVIARLASKTDDKV